MGLKPSLFHSSAMASNTVGGLVLSEKGRGVRLDCEAHDNDKHRNHQFALLLFLLVGPYLLTELRESSSWRDLALALVRKRHLTSSWIKHIMRRR